jgi:hypothetical protein
MPANTSPIFIINGNIAVARISAANTTSDGSGSLVTVLTAGANGSRVDGIRFRNSQVSLAASSSMVHRIFLSDTAGTNFRIIGEVATAAATRSAIAVGATSIFTFDQPIIMKPGQVMSVCQSVYVGVQDQFDVTAYAGDY